MIVSRRMAVLHMSALCFRLAEFHALWRTGGQLMGSVRLAADILRNLCFAPGCTEGVLPMRGEENGRNVRRYAPPAVTVWTDPLSGLPSAGKTNMM